MNRRIACYIFLVLLVSSLALIAPALAQGAPLTINTINEMNYSVSRASIYIDGAFYGYSDMLGHFQLDVFPMGNHTVSATCDGYVNATVDADLAPGATIDLVMPHVYSVEGNGTVTFIVYENTVAFSKVTGADVYVDNTLIGKTNTVGGRVTATVPAGVHEVKVSKPESIDLIDNTTTLDIQPGGTYIILMSLSGKQYSILDANLFVLSMQKILFNGLINTIELSVVAFAIGICIGLIMGIGRTSAFMPFRMAASVYVEGVRGLPLVLQLLFVNFGLPYLISQLLNSNFNINIFTACVIALSANSGAYMGEIFKAGIEAVHKGQTEAARSLGMSHNQALRFIILPQAFKIVLPALGNEFIALIKDSSIALVISLPEVVYWAKMTGAVYYNTFTPYLAAGIVYLMITIPLGKAVQYVEKRYNVNARKDKLPGKKKAGGLPEVAA